MARGWQPRKGDVSPRKGMGIAPQTDEWENDEEIETCIHAVVYEEPNWENLVCMSCGAEVENTEY